MTDDSIEQKALALVNEICLEKGVIPYAKLPNIEASEALCRAIEQHEAFRQEVSDAVANWFVEHIRRMIVQPTQSDALKAENERLREHLISALDTLKDAEICNDECGPCNDARAALEQSK